MRALLLPLLIMTALTCHGLARGEQVTIYRCTDAKGKLTLRDSPCQRGEKQQLQEMIRPRDARPVASHPSVAPRTREVETVRYVMQPVPRPLYACISPDGQRYLSETAEGQPRWVPAWVAASSSYPYPPVTIAHHHGELGWRGRHGSVSIGGGRQYIAGAPVIGSPGHPVPIVAGGGYWMHDACTALSASETCATLSDRQHQIRIRYAQAMPSERRLLDSESATLDTRMRQECGT